MSQTFTFNVTEVQEVRQRAAEAWWEQFPEDLPEGWSKSPVDLSAVVAVFPALRIKERWTLRAYQYRLWNDGNGVVWAMPEDQPFPEPEEDPTTEELIPPAGALEDFMEAMAGDGSPWSYLCASLLARELAEVGTLGHGSYWVAFALLGSDPWADPDQPGLAESEWSPTGPPGDWEWAEPKPTDWRPVVDVQENQVTVTFYTFCGLETERITRHTDTYPAGSYSFQTEEQVIATGPRGYVW